MEDTTVKVALIDEHSSQQLSGYFGRSLNEKENFVYQFLKPISQAYHVVLKLISF